MAKSPEDRSLATEQFPGLNRVFYTSKSGPHHYIYQRLRGLFLATSDSDKIAAAAEGFQIGTLKASFGIKDEDEAEQERKARADFLISESTVLLHHAGEALIRLYLAHLGSPECPRLEAARLRDYRSFKKRLTNLPKTLAEDESRRDLMAVFTGQHAADAENGVDEEAWTRQCEGVLSHC